MVVRLFSIGNSFVSHKGVKDTTLTFFVPFVPL